MHLQSRGLFVLRLPQMFRSAHYHHCLGCVFCRVNGIPVLVIVSVNTYHRQNDRFYSDNGAILKVKLGPSLPGLGNWHLESIEGPLVRLERDFYLSFWHDTSEAFIQDFHFGPGTVKVYTRAAPNDEHELAKTEESGDHRTAGLVGMNLLA